MSDSECSSRCLRPKTPEESDIRLAPLAIGQDSVLAEVPLFSATITTEILRGSTFINDDYYPRFPPSPYFRRLSWGSMEETSETLSVGNTVLNVHYVIQIMRLY